MATKNNIRSIRFSDELAELIDNQVGDTFTQKFENLVTRCVWELPAKEEQLQRINEQIKQQRKKLKNYQNLIFELTYRSEDISLKMEALERAIQQAEDTINKDM